MVTAAQRVLTDSAGAFVIGGIPAGPVTISVRRLGYQPGEIIAAVRAGDTTSVHIMLKRSAAALDTVRVYAGSCTAFGDRGFDCRKRRGLPGVFLDARALDSIGARTIPQLFHDRRGFRVVPVKPKLGEPVHAVQATTGWRCLVELVDGHPADVDRNPMPLTPEELYAVEIYATPREVPPELQRYVWKGTGRNRTPCSVVMYWTSGAKRKRGASGDGHQQTTGSERPDVASYRSTST